MVSVVVEKRILRGEAPMMGDSKPQRGLFYSLSLETRSSFPATGRVTMTVLGR